MTGLFLTVIVGFIGATAATKLKVPAGAMVGALIATAFFNIMTGKAFMPQDVKVITQIAAGAFIGAGISRKDVLDLRYIIKPAVLMVISMLVLNLLMGYVMHRVSGIDLITCLFASAPAGVVDMSLISSDLGADTSKVTILQMVRLLFVLSIFPILIKSIHSKLNSTSIQGVTKDEVVCTVSDEETKNTKETTKTKAVNLSCTLIVALAAGMVGYLLKIPAGTMTFSMAAVGTLNITTGRGYMPLNLRRATQVFAGILVGERMTYADIIALKSVMLPACILIIGIIILNLFIGYIINKTSGIELVTSLLASAPGGMSDMALIAKDLGGDAPKVAVMQLSRYVCIVAFFPILIKYVSLLL
jgi:membrane AbrB-like protein